MMAAAGVPFAIHEPPPMPSGKTLLVEIYSPSNKCASANFSGVLKNLTAVSSYYIPTIQFKIAILNSI